MPPLRDWFQYVSERIVAFQGSYVPSRGTFLVAPFAHRNLLGWKAPVGWSDREFALAVVEMVEHGDWIEAIYVNGVEIEQSEQMIRFFNHYHVVPKAQWQKDGF
jgi:hypothetical protein